MRNRIRHELLPLLQREYAPGAVEALMRLGTLAAEAQEVITAAAEQLADRAATCRQADTVTIDCRQLTDVPRHLLREMLLTLWQRQAWPLGAMGFAGWQALAEMARSDGADAKRTFPGAITAERRGDLLTLTAAASPQD